MSTLFERLGGRDGIATLVDDIVAAHLANDTIKARFLPHAEDAEHFAVLKGHLARFLEAGSGGPGAYSGRTMPDAHRGLNISEAEYMAAIDDILDVLTAHEIDPGTRGEVLGIAWSLKGEIMHL